MIICMSFTASKEYGTYKHTLTVDEMPNHSHSVQSGIHETSNKENWGYFPYRASDIMDTKCIPNTNNTGGSQPHNNIQPSLVVYFWRRTA